MNGANLPQLAGASDLAAAVELTRRHQTAAVAQAGQRLGAMIEAMQASPPVFAGDQLVDAVVEADPCTCPPAYICASSCEHCAGLADDVPCPHDLDPPAPSLAHVVGPGGPAVLVGPPAGVGSEFDELPTVDETIVYVGPVPVGRLGPVAHLDVFDESTTVTPAMVAEVREVEAGRSARIEAAAEAARIEDELRRVEVELAQARVDRDAAAGVVAIEAGRPSTGSLPTLDWRGRHDIRSLAYGVREHLLTAGERLQLGNVLLPIGPTLDQGAEGDCVGMAIVAAANIHDELAGGLDQVDLDESDARQLMERAKRLDDRPGENYAGTSALAGMKAAVEAGLWHRYLWSFGTRDLAGAIMRRRPVVIGVPWLSGMYDTAEGGRVELVGDDIGMGHCLVVVGLRLTGPQGQPGPWFVWQNSWGSDYGDEGLGYVHHRDLARLLRSKGEAAVPLPPGADW